VFALLTQQNKPHDKKWLMPLFGFARPPPNKEKFNWNIKDKNN